MLRFNGKHTIIWEHKVNDDCAETDYYNGDELHVKILERTTFPGPLKKSEATHCFYVENSEGYRAYIFSYRDNKVVEVK